MQRGSRRGGLFAAGFATLALVLAACSATPQPSDTSSAGAPATTGAAPAAGGNLVVGVTSDRNEARKWYEKAAAFNDYYSMASLGWLYDAGNGVKQDYVEALNWYEKAANGGNTYAMGNLSRLYDQGLGTRANAKEAARWAAFPGDPA